ncbi:hypothetical protein A2382_01660 [Candidatus Woesebacteria bacterium RIFOXYB1_FULL_38_16]|uniref:Uncharacterized protein n=1 Tax=Candidatus Woesebacteria bacterium RIFOXYB1_FULL_38_16 TaxID=1802538 RepID=A0A1F8CUX9_9BACT|nr:MAG: hypothetical protein A2191_03240 [Candidatus Woesebacteria bacterium RIFOXYA1_FULL_38_9]OGM80130.1 MAG: hypothetical protein A2382_01660 [Candidatus Woesebacteria bacterium RIFOXYB1_FULL_38_16]
MNNLLPKINLILTLVLTLGVSLLGYFFYQLRGQVTLLNNNTPAISKTSVPNTTTTTPPSGEDNNLSLSETNTFASKESLAVLKDYLDQSLATFSASLSKKTTTTTQTSTPSTQTSYISLGDTYTTTSTSWVDVPGSEVYIDLVNDYSQKATVTWSASLKVAHSNGQAFARLYDATNKIALINSELTTINNAAYSQVTSGNLALWRGKNLYKIQVKSLNSFETTVTGGRIKITY